ncbi:hypothetical protein ABVT39_004275 [Epinephelus coioides]
MLDKLVLNFVCEGNQPFSVVETPSFKTMIETLQPHTVMTRKTLCTRIQEAAKHKKSIIIKKLSAVNYVATTTDCWSARQRSYLGVTCHWIDNTSLERHSAALACRLVKGLHMFDVLAAALEEIHSEYHIREKVTRTTTDSGSNFLKDYMDYSVSVTNHRVAIVRSSGLDYIRNHLDTDLDDVTSTSLSDEDDFFASMESRKSQVGELERYLSCLSTAFMDLLHTFPHIKKLSTQSTGLPASAACERLFSHEGLLFTAKRSQLHCKNLESQLLLKLNSHITE